MAISDLSAGYKKSARLLRKRLNELREAARQTTDPEEKWQLKRRIADLQPLLNQMNDLAELTARYYEPGYYRNPKYSSNCFHDLNINYNEKENQ